ncbi:MAG: ABC transporter ATP-binding protein [Burkholderiales bacterium]
MSGPALLALHGVSVALPAWADRKLAVSDVSLELRRNQILCVVGESGSGKSVLARSIMGLLPAPHVRVSGGRVVFDGEDLLKAVPERMRAIRGARIAMIFQEPMTALNPLMNIGRQIEEMVEVHLALTRKERRERIVALLEEVRLDDPDRIMRAYPHELSGGQRQRAMIAMALILEPAIVIADEPTTALDVTTQAQILALIKELQRKHQTGVLFITHDFGVVAEIADHVAVMQHGVLVERGAAGQILNEPQHAYTRSLIGAVPSLAPRGRRDGGDSPVLLEVSGVSKTFGAGASWFSRRDRRVRAVKSVGLTVRRGRTLGLVGESGSGKSTLARCILRLIEPDAGSVHLGDIDLSALSRRQLRPHRKRMQMVFQDPFGSLNPRLTVVQLIAQGPITHGVPESEARAIARDLLHLVRLDPAAADRFPHEFSGGQRQRIGIARALALKPDVLVADEPVSALDVSVQAQVLQMLADIRDRLKLTMLFITHDLRVAAQVCDEIAVMRQGEIVESGPTAEVFSDPQHAYTRELLAAVPGRNWLPPAFSDTPAAERTLR